MNTATTTMDCPPPPFTFHSSQIPKDFILNRPFHHMSSNSLQLEASSLDNSSNCRGSRKEQRGETATSQLSDGKSTTPKSSAELVKEISMLDIEIEHLERYLLSLYRNAFQQHLPSVKGNHEICVQQISGPSPVVTFDKASQEKKLGMRKDLYDHQDKSSPTSAIAGSNDLDQVANSESSSGRERSTYHLGGSCIQDAGGFSVSSTFSFWSSSTCSPRNLSGSWSPQWCVLHVQASAGMFD